jgi:hypothetical protein
MKLPTEQEWQEWKQHPCSEALQKILRNWQESLKSQWAAGTFTDQSQFGTAISNAKAIGNCEAFERVLELEYEQLESELDDGKQ